MKWALLQRLAAVRGRLSLCADQAAAAKWWLSMPMASVSAEGPMPKALSTRRTSPLMPGGGRAFGPRPRDYRTDLPKKQRHAALVSALSLKATENNVSVLEGISVDAPKTAKVAGVLKKMGVYGKRTLLVVEDHAEMRRVLVDLLGDRFSLRVAADVATAVPAPIMAPVFTHQDIALRAHDLYVQSGYQGHREVEFWLEAERQLRDGVTV